MDPVKKSRTAQCIYRLNKQLGLSRKLSIAALKKEYNKEAYFADGIPVFARNGGHPEQRGKVFPKRGEKRIIFIPSRDRQRLVEILRRFQRPADCQIAQGKSRVHKIFGGQGNQPFVHLQRGFHAGDGQFVFFSQNQVGNPTGFNLIRGLGPPPSYPD